MSRTKAELIKRCEELGIDTEPLTNNDLREEAIAAKEAELAKAEKEAAEESKKETSEATPETPEATKGKAPESPETPESKPEETAQASEATKEKVADHYEDDRGRKWVFKPTAPKTLNIDGHPMSQAEILETEEVVSELVYGNCSHLTQINE